MQWLARRFDAQAHAAMGIVLPVPVKPVRVQLRCFDGTDSGFASRTARTTVFFFIICTTGYVPVRYCTAESVTVTVCVFRQHRNTSEIFHDGDWQTLRNIKYHSWTTGFTHRQEGSCYRAECRDKVCHLVHGTGCRLRWRRSCHARASERGVSDGEERR